VAQTRQNILSKGGNGLNGKKGHEDLQHHGKEITSVKVGGGTLVQKKVLEWGGATCWKVGGRLYRWGGSLYKLHPQEWYEPRDR